MLALKGKRQSPQAQGQPATTSKAVGDRPQKTEEKHCFPLVPCLNRPEQLAAKGGDDGLKFLKMIVVMAVLVMALGLGACAQHKEVVPPPQKKSYGK